MKTQKESHVKTDESGVFTSQGALKMAGQLSEARKRQGRILPRVLEGTWPCRHLDFGLLDSRNANSKIMLF